jgi:dTDP-4-dehydrorhamnose reductase
MAEGKVVILGGRGMLGTELANECGRRGIDFEVFDLPEFDITNHRQLKDAVSGSSTVVNCAAYTDVEQAEREYELAYRVNAEAAGYLAALAKKTGAYVLHISTDFVFDGKSDRPYVETDLPDPINAYGKSKLVGEQLLVQSGCSCCIIRLQWTYGPAGNNFVTKLIDRANRDRNIKVVDDQRGSPTATIEAAKVICELLPRRPEGLFHFAAGGFVSRFGMAKFIFENMDMSVKLIACKSGDFPTLATRPLNSCFNCSKIQALLERPIEAWQGPLRRFLERL